MNKFLSYLKSMCRYRSAPMREGDERERINSISNKTTEELLLLLSRATDLTVA